MQIVTAAIVDMWQVPDLLVPTTVNFLPGHELFGISWDLWLAALALLTLVMLVLAGHRLAPALLAGFVVAWIALDLRTMLDHAAVMHGVETNEARLPGLDEAKAFAARAGPIIGQGSWAVDPSLREYALVEHYFGYALAESPRVQLDQAEHVITLAPGAERAVLAHGPFALARRGAP